ncbi:energy-coupling factor ABC transporter permease [Solirubrobacter sp. CPCC 204708]|uniref:Energy-coupling factor ABC transporter permease n=1 Tax=Solirubrobacter deserti TaxID=2282478 RepID=A0ABT4RKF8_9ACTN|nr:energy-coupling factor ABC transporter permease [Solirubrobacter deserti]MBE2315833.1 energy-coupling factor ABC transporter permease [Solirubrobacter deserti]MDA0138831.1 energy-coupling factor ABC transporter permease [Solirubrobacter deserti]
MHIPDGFLTTEVAVACALPGAAAVGVALRRADADLEERRVPLLGVTAAFVFAAQMLNFPVAGGTSGHFMGAALAAILLGPWLACLVLAVVLGVQALLFADGGITALGANALNMGVIGALLVGGLMHGARRLFGEGRTTLLAVSGAGAWLAVMAGAAATAAQLALSGTVPLGTVMPAMLGVHTLIGVGEAVVTVAAVSAVLTTRPDLIAAAPGLRPIALRRAFAVLALAVAVGLATAASPFASSHPDGLERVAQDEGFIEDGRLAAIQQDAPIPDYAFPEVSDERIATGLAGFTGTLLVFGAGYGVARLARRRAVA